MAAPCLLKLKERADPEGAGLGTRMNGMDRMHADVYDPKGGSRHVPASCS